jgi:hypothetical protein
MNSTLRFWTPMVTRLIAPLLLLLSFSPAEARPLTSDASTTSLIASTTNEVELLDSSRAAWLNLLHNENYLGSPGYIHSWDSANSKTRIPLNFKFEPNTAAPLEVIHSEKVGPNHHLLPNRKLEP